jgi:tripartite-type tricarboxylate transporter receptor subunit TctC
MHRREFLALAGATLAGGVSTRAWSQAQGWPDRPVKLILPYAPGGATDLIGRPWADKLSQAFGQQFVIENRGGASGIIGTEAAAKAAPDGYTFVIGNSGTHAYSQSLYKKLPYNAATEFDPVGIVTESPRALIARKNLPANNLQEFIAYLKANEKTAQFGSAGVGAGTHIPCVLLNSAIGVNITHIPYRGEAPVVQDLIGGRVDYMCATIQSGAALINQGQVKGIAVLSEGPVPISPEIPTSGEQGLPGVESSVWNAFFVPKGTPEPIVRKLNTAMSDTLDDPAIRKRLEELGLEIVPVERRSPEYLVSFLPQEIERWAKPIRQAGISAD